MTISSRMPEGSPNRCPVCGHEIRITPSQPPGDAPCPDCGTLLWFLSRGLEQTIFHASDSHWLELLAERLGVSLESLNDRDAERLADAITSAGVDSLDLVELIMELEEEPS